MTTPFFAEEDPEETPKTRRHAGGAADADTVLDDPVFRPRSLRAFAERGFKATLKVPTLWTEYYRHIAPIWLAAFLASHGGVE